MSNDKPPEVEAPPIDGPFKAENVESETCPVCGNKFAHVSDAPVTVHNADGDICLTSFGVVFFH